jgi:hypothetical protein
MDSSGSASKHSDGTSVPGRAMQSVAVSEMLHKAFCRILKSTAAHYYIIYCIDLSEHCAVAV